MTKKILLINVHSDENAGDAALTMIAIEQLKEAFPSSQLTIVMNDPASHQGDEKVIGSFLTQIKESYPDRPPRWRIKALIGLAFISLMVGVSSRTFSRPSLWAVPAAWKELFQAYLDCDLVVSNPGGFLYSSGKLGLSLLYNAYTLALAWIMKKPFYLLPQSIGPISNKWDGFIIRSILSQARIIMVREPVSLEQLKQIGMTHPRLLLIPDLALTFKGEKSEAARHWLKYSGLENVRKPRLGITAINWGVENFRFQNQTAYEEAIEEAARYFIERLDGEVYLFTQVHGPTPGQDDRIPAGRIKDRLANYQTQIHMVVDPLPSPLRQAVYGEMDIFIGTRLHSAIFALCRGTPVLAIGYQYKTRGIYHMLEMENWTIDIEDVEPERLTRKLADLWEQRENVSRQICSILPKLAQQASQAGKLIAEDFQLISEN